MWFTQDGIRPHRNFQSFIIITSIKVKGYNLQQPHYTSSSLSHSLSHTIKEIVLQCYNTIHNRITIPSFYRGIIMGKYDRSPNTMGPQTVGQQTSQKFLLGASPLNPLSRVVSPKPLQGDDAPPHPPCQMSVQ